MRRLVYLLILVSMLGLAACSGGAAPTATATTVPTVPVQPTAIINPTLPITAPVTLGKLGDPTACNVVSMLPAPMEGLPPVSDSDWVMGNRDARLTILEYSDFQ